MRAVVLFTLQRKRGTNMRRTQFQGYLAQQGSGSTLVAIVIDEEKNGYMMKDQEMRNPSPYAL